MPAEVIENVILLCRGQKIILDTDLADIYGVSELELYRERGGWKLDSPHTAVRIRERDGPVTTGYCNQIRLHEYQMRRNDFFNVRGASGNARR